MKQQTDLKFEEMKKENTRTYSEQLLEKRLDLYPMLNQVIMRFMTDIRTQHMTLENLKKLYAGLKEWDIEHSLLMSFKSRSAFSGLMKYLRTALIIKTG